MERYASVPRYLEAYCRLPVAALLRGHARGQGTLVWRDRYSTTIGSALVANCTDQVLSVMFDIGASGAVEAFMGKLEIQLCWQSAGLHRREPYAVCPACECLVRHLVAKEYRWQCGSCQHLVNRSALLRTNTRLTEQVNVAERLYGSGRPKGMHEKVYRRHLERLQLAKERLGSHSLSADARYMHVVTHHIAGSRATLTSMLASSSSLKSSEQRLFTKRLFAYINDTFVSKANIALHASAAGTPVDELIGAITAEARLQPLTVGVPRERAATGSGGLAETIVEIPYVGDVAWLHVRSEVGDALPPLFAEIDETASVVRFAWNGLVSDRPALRVQIDEQIGLLRENLARQHQSVVEYHKQLPASAANYLRWLGAS